MIWIWPSFCKGNESKKYKYTHNKKHIGKCGMCTVLCMDATITDMTCQVNEMKFTCSRKIIENNNN